MIQLKDIEPYVATIEEHGFHHVASNILAFAPDVKYLRDYLHSLVFDHRGNRTGFPKPVMCALFQIHKMLSDDPQDIWSLTMLK